LIPHAPPIGEPADLEEDASGMTAEDGYIPDGEMLSPFDMTHPALTNLDINLLRAVQRAWADAALVDIDLYVTSGWRSVRYQQHLLDEGIAFYGSEEEARKWVNTPEQSTHVSGNAIDIGPMEAYIWLSERSHIYGLCQTYANEQWHYELPTGPDGECPPQLEDASAGQ
jgi:zinc D-Ala-D-Ala carboxypeptidase